MMMRYGLIHCKIFQKKMKMIIYILYPNMIYCVRFLKGKTSSIGLHCLICWAYVYFFSLDQSPTSDYEQIFWNVNTYHYYWCTHLCPWSSLCKWCQHWQQATQGQDVLVSEWTIPLLRKCHLNLTDWILLPVSSGFRLTRWMPNQH